MRVTYAIVISVLTFCVFSATSALAQPKTIYIIRHAEKTDEGEKSSDLSKAGYKRADALADQFVQKFALPDFLIATQRSKGSNRPIETVTPLSKKLDQPIDATFADDDYDKLAHELLTNPKYNDKIVLIVWHKGRIPALATALGINDAPTEWKAEIFDRVWKITFDHGQTTMKDLPQKLMPGDSEN